MIEKWSSKELCLMIALAATTVCFGTGGFCQTAQAPEATSPADQFFDSNGVRIHYVSVGKGEPVLLIHGWSADLRMWDSAKQDL